MDQNTSFSAEIDGFPEFADDGSHLDDFAAADLGEIGEGVDPLSVEHMDVANTNGPPMMDKEAFWIVFSTGFSLPQFINAKYAPLAIQDEETISARGASDAIHSLLEIWYPQTLVPGGETVAHLLVALPFVIGKVMIMRAIAADAKQPRDVTPANENRAPEPKEAAPDTEAETVPSDLSWMDVEEAA